MLFFYTFPLVALIIARLRFKSLSFFVKIRTYLSMIDQSSVTVQFTVLTRTREQLPIFLILVFTVLNT